MTPTELIWCALLSFTMTILFVFYTSMRFKMRMCAIGKDLRCKKTCMCPKVSGSGSQTVQGTAALQNTGTGTVLYYDPHPTLSEYQNDVFKTNGGVSIGFVYCNVDFSGADYGTSFTQTTTYYLPNDSQKITCDPTQDVCCGTQIAFTTRPDVEGVSTSVNYVVPFTVDSRSIIQSNVSGWRSAGNQIDISNTGGGDYIDTTTLSSQFEIHNIKSSDVKTDAPKILDKISSSDTSHYNIVQDEIALVNSLNMIQDDGTSQNTNSRIDVCIDPTITSFPPGCTNNMFGFYKKDTGTYIRVDISKQSRSSSGNVIPGVIFCGPRYDISQLTDVNVNGNGGNPQVSSISAFGEGSQPVSNKNFKQGKDINNKTITGIVPAYGSTADTITDGSTNRQSKNSRLLCAYGAKLTSQDVYNAHATNGYVLVQKQSGPTN